MQPLLQSFSSQRKRPVPLTTYSMSLFIVGTHSVELIQSVYYKAPNYQLYTMYYSNLPDLQLH